jgi:tRNA pseudouridine38-40 synthase
MPRYFLELAYNGTAYRGWQRQPDAPSVQAEVERALRFNLHLPELFVVGCGRTDTGVHATRFYLHFDVPEERELGERFVYGVNSLLPPDIAVFRVIPVSDEAHARFSATERGYRYLINQHKDPFLAGRSYELRPPLDLEAMAAAVPALLGRQDFSSFCLAGSDNKTMLCDVRHAAWERTEKGYAFTIRADRFLRNMVRAIVGTFVRIGKGEQPYTHMADVIAARDRGAAGKSAPARGLYLEHVTYPFLEP